LGKDRRTLGRALRNVAPDGTTGDGYRQRYVLLAL
jgi:hypothetical protein